MLEKAKRAKEKAAREAMEVQGLILKPTTEAADVTSTSSTTSVETPANSPLSNPNSPRPPNEDPVLGVPNE